MQRKYTSLVGALLAVLVVIVAGCYPSENPIWTPDTLVYYPELLGTYQDGEATTEKNTTTLEKGEAEKSYHVITRDGKGEKTGEAVLHLMKLDDTIFYDYQPSGVKLDSFKPPPKQCHLFGRLTIKDTRITLYSFGANMIGDKPFGDKAFADDLFHWKNLRPATMPATATTRRREADMRIISNTTEELQAILKANAERMNVQSGSFTKLSN